MAHSPLGWSYPEGCSGPPEPAPPRTPLRCGQCGRFLPRQADHNESVEDGLDCNGVLIHHHAPCGREEPHDAHREIFFTGTREFRMCRCGHVNTSIQ